KRIKDLKPYQVTPKIMQQAKKTAIFMHDLPGLRGMEVTAAVMDSKQSVIYDQAENRLHMEKAVLLWLLQKK
ncbi:MAG: ornithine carbamoyltransferase, partial [Nanoarchaeota archaeon]